MVEYPLRKGKLLRLLVEVRGFSSRDAAGIEEKITALVEGEYGGELAKVKRVTPALVRRLAKDVEQ
jgi:hypothetical protein